MLERLFKLKENNTDVKTEFIAGLTTFMAMAYIIVVNPAIIAASGMDYYAAFTATIIATVVGTLIMGLYANVPYVQAPGMGLNVLFSYTICIGLGFTWEQALAMVFICGIFNIIFTATRLRRLLLDNIPLFLQHAIGVGIGLLVTYIGIKNANLITFSISKITDGVAQASDVTPLISTFNSPEIILAIIGLVVTSIFLVKKVKGGILFGIIITTLIGIPLGVTNIGAIEPLHISLATSFLKLDFAGLFTYKAGIVVVVMTILTLSLSDIFDTIGTFIGTGQKSGIFGEHLSESTGEKNKKLEKALYADSVATSIGAIIGTSNTTTFVESAAGIEVGGRTGLTSVFVAILFLIALFFAPLIGAIPTVATAPALILVGLFMVESIVKIKWKDLVIAIPAFFTIVFMPFSYSITSGIEMGFIFYIIVKGVKGEYKDVHPILYAFVALFIIDFLYKALF
ncbi:MAG: NCS2 family permease [Methanobrevibacter sp.]|jgi:AGZA family xanthine/uracil permease-like MFS transporter|nr:NCS2 family permease [Methanobrevibacter sp.]